MGLKGENVSTKNQQPQVEMEGSPCTLTLSIEEDGYGEYIVTGCVHYGDPDNHLCEEEEFGCGRYETIEAAQKRLFAEADDWRAMGEIRRVSITLAGPPETWQHS